ncbi:helix-turn-helix domain-containing protein [Xenophilus arseniciresistens]|uniref:Helix-turn-helix domain-containing protein n=1 Tax=Xenophilus arseniciresistens TaxID=1283306 RepID=A0AAE3NA98_9BURK|nr:helix-turn-helix domain-containing protein [Xenophilus arseniciresistens]MDA7417683.1 helix-turn-helix domain-containing protein [Xenophilus arseniciresistens]
MQTERVAHADAGARLMWLTSQRVFYAGLLGSVGLRTSGGWAIYVSPSGLPNRVRLGGGAWQGGELIVVPPLVPHCIESQEPLILNLVIEAELVDPQALPPLLRQCGVVDDPDFVRRVRAVHAQLQAASGRKCFNGFDFDRLVFGQPLPERVLDPRIRAVVDRVNANPAEAVSAEQCAAAVNLSFSRFLHLFKAQTGVTFRAFRAWKRARSLLRYVRESSSLTDIALTAGYPDSTHFSHSIRQFYGLRPSDIVAGSRRLALHHAGRVVL